jgi:hypothetical protein
MVAVVGSQFLTVQLILVGELGLGVEGVKMGAIHNLML